MIHSGILATSGDILSVSSKSDENISAGIYLNGNSKADLESNNVTITAKSQSGEAFALVIQDAMFDEDNPEQSSVTIKSNSAKFIASSEDTTGETTANSIRVQGNSSLDIQSDKIFIQA